MKSISDSTRAKNLLDAIKGKTDGEAMTLMREQFRQVRGETEPAKPAGGPKAYIALKNSSPLMEVDDD